MSRVLGRDSVSRGNQLGWAETPLRRGITSADFYVRQLGQKKQGLHTD